MRKKISKVYLLSAIGLFLMISGVEIMAAEPNESGITEPKQTDVFVSLKDGVTVYRIPTLILSPNGVILAFCERRNTGPGDHGDIDLVVKRSADLGETWSDEILIVEGQGKTAGNPAPVVDGDTGTIWLPFTIDNDTVLVTSSQDDGLTWSTPRDITADVKPEGWEWYATGPVHGIQLSTGRLLIPCDHHVKGQNYSHAIYSDDQGQTWKLGGTVDKLTDECTVVELADGSVLINMRSYHMKGIRTSAVSKDGGLTWSEIKFERELTEPVCQGSLLRYSLADQDDKNRILFSNPSSRSRDHLTIKLSYDEAQTWPVATMLNEGPSGYSDMVLLPDMTVGVLYERGDKMYWENLTFARFTLDWLIQGKTDH